MSVAATIDLGEIRRICIIGWGLIGDLFLRVPLIEALHSRFPRAHITVLVDPPGVKVLANHPACSRVLAVPRTKHPTWSWLCNGLRTGIALRRERFDVSVDLYGGGSSGWATWLINARWRIGFDHRRDLRVANNVLVTRPSFCRHWTRELATLLEPLGIGADSVRCGTSYYCDEAARREAKRIVAGYDTQRLLAINLGAGDARKCWPVARFVDLAHELQRRDGLIPVVFRNPGQEHLADSFAASFRGEAIFPPRLELNIVAGLLEMCRAIVTADSALMHLAIGLKRPVLALFTQTRPEAVWPDDCVFVACIREKINVADRCGRPTPDPDLPVDAALAAYDELARLAAGDLARSTG